jgi:sec-independent protein translocase protein TatC
MTKFIKNLWKIITFPFILAYKTIAYPVVLIHNANRFLNRELEEDRPFLETFSSIATEADARESLWEHIEVLRAHLLRIVVALVVGVGVSFYFSEKLMGYLAMPAGGLQKLQAIGVTEELGVFMRVALTSGIAIILPYLAFEIWLFAAPGLKPRERKMGLVGIPLAAGLFLSGMAFTFFVLLPTALPFLGGFTDIAEFWTASEYFGFITGLMLWIGLFFEFPLVVYVLTSIGLVKPKLLLQQWRIAVIVIAVIAAAITPTIDPVTMGLTMLPMIFLYFISIGLSFIAFAGRRQKESAAADGEKNPV